MSNINEKLSVFEKTIMDDAKKEADEILAEFEAKKSKIASKIKLEAQKEANSVLGSEKEKLLRAENEKISEEAAVYKRELLNTRREIENKVFEEVEEKISEFRKSEKYFDFLKKAVADAAESVGEGEKIIYIDKKDAEFKPLLEEIFSYPVVIASAEIKGGARVSNTDKNIVCDNTVSDRLLEEKDAFLELSGLKIEV